MSDTVDPLREAATAVMDEWDALGPTGTESTLSAHRALRAALAAAPRPEGLDVERLIDALMDEYDRKVAEGAAYPKGYRGRAERLASYYEKHS